MLEPTIDKKDLEKWAGFLLDHSLGGIETNDRVMIKGERICWPLMEVLERKVIEAGGIPDVCLVPPNNERGRVWSSAMGRVGSAEQIERVPDWHGMRFEGMTKYIEVLGAEDPSQYTGLSADQIKRLALADRPFANIRLAKPWVLTLFPTPGFAELEGMDLNEYVGFIVRASTTDPRPLKKAEDKIAPYLERASKVTIETHHPHENRELKLTLGLEGCRVISCYGLRNFPDGEVFTSPDARSAQGEIFVDLPVHYGGQDIQGIYLKFERGRITSYKADVGHDQLQGVIETDDGSHRLGEIAFGMNPGLEKVLKHPLFVEKVGGTLHIAIGLSYEDAFVEDPSSVGGKKKLEQLEAAGILNRSAQHVDIVTDFRGGGTGRRVFLDDVELVVENGIWKVP
ncbi:MAG: aminopeptidase [Pseudomonadota bacterium]